MRSIYLTNHRPTVSPRHTTGSVKKQVHHAIDKTPSIKPEQGQPTNTNILVVGGKLSKDPLSTVLNKRFCYLLILTHWHPEANQILPITIYCYLPELRRIICQLRKGDEVIAIGRLGYDIQKGQVELSLLAHEIRQGDVTIEVKSGKKW